MSMSPLMGRSYELDLGPFIPRLTFLSDKQLRLQATIGENVIDEVVVPEIETLRPNLFLMTWVEQSGTFVVQVHDHEKGVVHNHARLANGQLFRARGDIKPVEPL